VGRQQACRCGREDRGRRLATLRQSRALGRYPAAAGRAGLAVPSLRALGWGRPARASARVQGSFLGVSCLPNAQRAAVIRGTLADRHPGLHTSGASPRRARPCIWVSANAAHALPASPVHNRAEAALTGPRDASFSVPASRQTRCQVLWSWEAPMFMLQNRAPHACGARAEGHSSGGAGLWAVGLWQYCMDCMDARHFCCASNRSLCRSGGAAGAALLLACHLLGWGPAARGLDQQAPDRSGGLRPRLQRLASVAAGHERTPGLRLVCGWRHCGHAYRTCKEAVVQREHCQAGRLRHSRRLNETVRAWASPTHCCSLR
jgi:hypothetical protein